MWPTELINHSSNGKEKKETIFIIIPQNAADFLGCYISGLVEMLNDKEALLRRNKQEIKKYLVMTADSLYKARRGMYKFSSNPNKKK